MKSILIIAFTQLQRDARVSRQIQFLRKSYRITAVGTDMSPDPEIKFIRVAKPKLTLPRKALLSMALLLRRYRTAHHLLHGEPDIDTIKAAGPFDLIIANDVESLPLAFDIDPNARVLFDAHEYAPRQFEDRLYWRIFFQHFNIYLCKTYIPRVKAMLTVSNGIAREFTKQFGITPVLMTNAPSFSNIGPSPLENNRIRMVHHGGAVRARKLEFMIEVMKKLDDRFTLDLMLMVPEMASSKTKGYIDQLQTLAKGDPRIRFVPPVPLNEVVGTLNKYDLGVYILPPINFNHANALPNKLFEYIQARLGLAFAPTPEMAAIVDEYKMGVVAKNFTPESLAEELSKLTTEDIKRFKENAGRAAEAFNAEKNERRLIEVVEGIVGTKN